MKTLVVARACWALLAPLVLLATAVLAAPAVGRNGAIYVGAYGGLAAIKDGE
jgi:hypothetical protein